MAPFFSAGGGCGAAGPAGVADGGEPDASMSAGSSRSLSAGAVARQLRAMGVTAAVRLNRPYYYDRTAFTDAGLEHADLYFEVVSFVVYCIARCAYERFTLLRRFKCMRT